MKQKGLTSILIVILIAVGLGGYLIYQKQLKPIPLPQPTTQPSPSSADETVNWSSDDGYSIRYPSTWYILFCGSAVILDPKPLSSCATDSPGTLIISVSNKTGDSLIRTGKEFKVVSRNTLTIGGEQGERVITEKIEAAPGADKIMVAAVEYKGKIFTFNLQDITQEETFNQILSTFRFD